MGLAWEDGSAQGGADVPRRVTWAELNGGSLALRDQGRWYTTGELAGALNVSQHTVRNLIKRGRLRAVKVGRAWRVSPGALEQFLRESR